MITTLINGIEKNTVSVFDRGLHYGDGLFETMAVHAGVVPLWAAHWDRLSVGCERLKISLPKRSTIEKEINSLCYNQNQLVIKLIITRGEGLRGYRFTAGSNVTRVVTSYPYPSYPETYQNDGVTVRYCETTLSENKLLAGIKHLNRLEQVLARNEWDTDDYQEGLMLDQHDQVIDGTMSNIFIVKDHVLSTPDLSLSGVAGVMRKTIIDIAKDLGLTVSVKEITPAELELADELFLSNSLFGIWPVKRIADTRFSKTGDITRQLQAEVKKKLRLK